MGQFRFSEPKKHTKGKHTCPRHCICPIAHDKVGVQIRNFMEGNIDFDTFLKKLAFMKGITFQYFFGTQRAIDLLEKI